MNCDDRVLRSQEDWLYHTMISGYPLGIHPGNGKFPPWKWMHWTTRVSFLWVINYINYISSNLWLRKLGHDAKGGHPTTFGHCPPLLRRSHQQDSLYSHSRWAGPPCPGRPKRLADSASGRRTSGISIFLSKFFFKTSFTTASMGWELQPKGHMGGEQGLCLSAMGYGLKGKCQGFLIPARFLYSPLCPWGAVECSKFHWSDLIWYMYFPSFCGRSNDLTHWPRKTIWWPSGVQNARVHATTGPPAFAINAACSPAGPAACKDPG